MPVPCFSIICSLTNKCTISIYYINCSITQLYIYYAPTCFEVSTPSSGSSMFLAKITCMTSVVTICYTDKIHKVQECDIEKQFVKCWFVK